MRPSFGNALSAQRHVDFCTASTWTVRLCRNEDVCLFRDALCLCPMQCFLGWPRQLTSDDDCVLDWLVKACQLMSQDCYG